MTDFDDPVEQSKDLERLRRAYQTACINLVELNDQRAKLTEALTAALLLLDQLLAEMRDKGVEPSPRIIAFKADFDKGMRQLLGHDRNEGD